MLFTTVKQQYHSNIIFLASTIAIPSTFDCIPFKITTNTIDFINAKILDHVFEEIAILLIRVKLRYKKRAIESVKVLLKSNCLEVWSAYKRWNNNILLFFLDQGIRLKCILWLFEKIKAFTVLIGFRHKVLVVIKVKR